MPSSTRRNARILAFQMIYSREKIGILESGESILFNNNPLSSEYKEFCHKLVALTWEKIEEIDSKIQEYLINWKQYRITDSLNALMRISICELMFFSNTDGKVILNEAIEICRSHVDERAIKILNGVLHSIWQNTMSEQTPTSS